MIEFGFKQLGGNNHGRSRAYPASVSARRYPRSNRLHHHRGSPRCRLLRGLRQRWRPRHRLPDTTPPSRSRVLPPADAGRLSARSPRALATLHRLHTLGASGYVQSHAAATLLDPSRLQATRVTDPAVGPVVNINLDPNAPRLGDGELTEVLPPQPAGSTDGLAELAHAAKVLGLDWASGTRRGRPRKERCQGAPARGHCAVEPPQHDRRAIPLSADPPGSFTTASILPRFHAHSIVAGPRRSAYFPI
jgi:hypothetical protein